MPAGAVGLTALLQAENYPLQVFILKYLILNYVFLYLSLWGYVYVYAYVYVYVWVCGCVYVCVCLWDMCMSVWKYIALGRQFRDFACLGDDLD